MNIPLFAVMTMVAQRRCVSRVKVEEAESPLFPLKDLSAANEVNFSWITFKGAAIGSTIQNYV